jgi:hypothetical protein
MVLKNGTAHAARGVTSQESVTRLGKLLKLLKSAF